MKCPYCGFDDQKVLDSRSARDGEAIRRRRECLKCDRRFTTFEAPERPRLFVIKRDGKYEEFSREKVMNSMIVACRKRPVTMDRLRAAAEWIEKEIFQAHDEEVPSTAIGERVMEHLRFLDQVAYVRFASVYREFQSIDEFKHLVESVGDSHEGITAGEPAVGRDKA